MTTCAITDSFIDRKSSWWRGKIVVVLPYDPEFLKTAEITAVRELYTVKLQFAVSSKDIRIAGHIEGKTNISETETSNQFLNHNCQKWIQYY